jgi:hypothetical protein
VVLRLGSFLQHLCARRGSAHLDSRRRSHRLPDKILAASGGLRVFNLVLHPLEPNRAHPPLLNQPDGHGAPCPYWATDLGFSGSWWRACPGARPRRWASVDKNPARV